MKIRNVRWNGRFDSAPIPGDKEHRLLVNDIRILFDYRPDGSRDWAEEGFWISKDRKWDGASVPSGIDWLIPRFGIFALASLAHDECFEARPPLTDGTRMSRKLADLLFLHLALKCAKLRVEGRAKYTAQVLMAWTMWRAVNLFGEPVWDKHDKEFR